MVVDSDDEHDGPQLKSSGNKKSKTAVDRYLHLLPAELSGLDTDELHDAIIALQDSLTETRSELEAEKTKSKNLEKAAKSKKQSVSAGTSETWSDEKVAERAEKLQNTCYREIKKQMKWVVRLPLAVSS